MSTSATESKITAAESEVANLPAGIPEGSVDKDNEAIPEPVRERIEHREAVVYDHGTDGKVAGWHKEAAPDDGGNQ